jgi:hypothetical protein
MFLRAYAIGLVAFVILPASVAYGQFVSVIGLQAGPGVGAALNSAASQSAKQPSGALSGVSSSNGVVNADLFPGADIGAKINAAIASLPGNFSPGSYGCGVVQVPYRSFSWFSTPIVKPQCTTLDLSGSTIGYNGPASFPAITVEDSFTNSLPVIGGIRNGRITGAGAGSGPIAAGSIGIFLGGVTTATAGYCTYSDVNSCLCALQTFDSLLVVGFANGWEFGANSHDNVWINNQIAANTVGLHVRPGGNSGEDEAFLGSHFFENRSHDIVVDSTAYVEIACEACSFNYTGGNSIVGPIHFSATDTHFENNLSGAHFFDCSGGGCSLDVKGGAVYMFGAVTSADAVGTFGGSNNQVTFDGPEFGLLGSVPLSQYFLWDDSSSVSSLQFTHPRQSIWFGSANLALATVPAYRSPHSHPPATFLADRQAAASSGAVANGTGQNAQGMSILNGAGAPTYPVTAPSGSCTAIGWAFSQDGHATFCDGTTWTRKM